jgi:hypothetical protein
VKASRLNRVDRRDDVDIVVDETGNLRFQAKKLIAVSALFRRHQGARC